jgi:predicted PurR-regulated permease PerM
MGGGDTEHPGTGLAVGDGTGATRVEIGGAIVWRAIGAVLVSMLLLAAARQAAGLVVVLGISFFFSLALQPGVGWLVARYHWRRGAATGVVYFLGALFVVLLLAGVIPAVAELARVVGEEAAIWMAELSRWLSGTFGIEVGDLGGAADAVAETGDLLGDFMLPPWGLLLGIAADGVAFVLSMVTIATFTFYFTADGPQIRRATLRVFGPQTQQRVGWTWDQAIAQTGGYFYSRMVLMLVNGLGFFFTMVLVGMPADLSLGLASFGAFVSVFIPLIGTYIGGAVPILLTLAVRGLTAALIVLGYVLVYQQVENYWLNPRLSAKTMALSGGVAFGAALAGGAIAGPMGAFTALPIAALISSFISNYVASHEVVYEGPLEDGSHEPPRTPVEDEGAGSESSDPPRRPDPVDEADRGVG